MRLVTRKRPVRRYRSKVGSPVTFDINYTGQGGANILIFKTDDRYFYMIPETLEDIRELQSQIGILANNFGETARRKARQGVLEQINTKRR